MASFFYTFLNHGLQGSHGFQKRRSRDLSIPAALESYQLSANVTAEAPVWDAAAVKE